MDIVRPDVPFLLGLDILDKEGLVANNVMNQLQSLKYNWSLPIERKLGHMFVSWESTSAYFTKPQLIRLHKHFYHPSAENLMELLKRSHPSDADEKTISLIKDCLLYTSPSPRDQRGSRMPSSA